MTGFTDFISDKKNGRLKEVKPASRMKLYFRGNKEQLLGPSQKALT